MRIKARLVLTIEAHPLWFPVRAASAWLPTYAVKRRGHKVRLVSVDRLLMWHPRWRVHRKRYVRVLGDGRRASFTLRMSRDRSMLKVSLRKPARRVQVIVSTPALMFNAFPPYWATRWRRHDSLHVTVWNALGSIQEATGRFRVELRRVGSAAPYRGKPRG